MALTTSQKAGWGLADAGIVVFVIVKQLLVLVFLTTVLGVPVNIAGAVTTGVLIFDMITDPLVGYYSDKTQSRWGRRAPWMASGAVVMCAGIIGLFAASPDAELAAKLVWVVAFFVVATVGFTMIAIPYGAMAGEITQDPKERSAMTAWRMTFASIGLLIGGAILPGLASGMGYMMAAVAITPVIIGAVWLSIFLTRRAPSLPAPEQVAVTQALGLVLKNRPFMFLTVLYGVMTLAVAILTAGLPFATMYLMLDNGQTALSGAADALTSFALLFAAFVVGAILSQPVWVKVSGLVGKVPALSIGLGLYAVICVALFSILPADNITMMALFFVAAGFANGAYQQIPWAIYPDLIDVTRDRSGMSIEGTFSAVWLFGQKLANALAPLILGQILAVRGWQETTGGAAVAQSTEALSALQVAMTFVPAAIFVLAVLAQLFIYRPMVRRAYATA